MDLTERLQPLIATAELKHKRVAIIGLGGVGGPAAEALVRCGVGHFLLVDYDVVEPSNLNRQVLFTAASIGKLKTEEAQQRLKQINPEVEVTIISAKLNEQNVHEITNVDYVIDAIDDVPAKVTIVKHCLKHNIPFVCATGAGNRLRMAGFNVVPLSQCLGDPLAKKFRQALRIAAVDLDQVPVCCSSELPQKRTPPASIIFVTAMAGLTISYHCLTTIAKQK